MRLGQIYFGPRPSQGSISSNGRDLTAIHGSPQNQRFDIRLQKFALQRIGSCEAQVRSAQVLMITDLPVYESKVYKKQPPNLQRQACVSDIVCPLTLSLELDRRPRIFNWKWGKGPSTEPCKIWSASQRRHSIQDRADPRRTSCTQIRNAM